MNEWLAVWLPGIILISVLFVIMAIPCIGISLLGYKMINKLGYFPSKTPAIQTSILVQLLIVELISIALLLTFYHALTEYDQQARIHLPFGRGSCR